MQMKDIVITVSMRADDDREDELIQGLLDALPAEEGRFESASGQTFHYDDDTEYTETRVIVLTAEELVEEKAALAYLEKMVEDMPEVAS